jgi:heat shock protein HslJ
MNKLLALGPALLIAACTPVGTASTPAPAAVTAEALTGSSWTITRIDDAPAKSPRAALRFDKERISMTAGCNGMGGSWKLEGNRLSGGPFMSTMMYCDGLMEQERALSQLLEAKPEVLRDGNQLTLRSASHSAVLVRAE